VQRECAAIGDYGDRNVLESERSAYLDVEQGMADVVVLRGIGRGSGSSRPMRVDEVDREEIGEERGIGPGHAGRQAGSSFEPQHRRALAQDLDGGLPTMTAIKHSLRSHHGLSPLESPTT